MQGKSSLSAKYNPKQSEQDIGSRFENATRCLGLTLERLQQTPDY